MSPEEFRDMDNVSIFAWCMGAFHRHMRVDDYVRADNELSEMSSRAAKAVPAVKPEMQQILHRCETLYEVELFKAAENMMSAMRQSETELAANNVSPHTRNRAEEIIFSGSRLIACIERTTRRRGKQHPSAEETGSTVVGGTIDLWQALHGVGGANNGLLARYVSLSRMALRVSTEVALWFSQRPAENVTGCGPMLVFATGIHDAIRLRVGSLMEIDDGATFSAIMREIVKVVADQLYPRVKEMWDAVKSGDMLEWVCDTNDHVLRGLNGVALAGNTIVFVKEKLEALHAFLESRKLSVNRVGEFDSMNETLKLCLGRLDDMTREVIEFAFERCIWKRQGPVIDKLPSSLYTPNVTPEETHFILNAFILRFVSRSGIARMEELQYLRFQANQTLYQGVLLKSAEKVAEKLKNHIDGIVMDDAGRASLEKDLELLADAYSNISLAFSGVRRLFWNVREDSPEGEQYSV